MPRNGAGTYVLPAGNPVVSGTTISSTVQNNTMNDIATALTGSIPRNGEAAATADLPMGNFKHTGVGNGTARNHYAAVGQVQDGSFEWLASIGGTADAITASTTPAFTAYTAGQAFKFTPTGSNTTNVTININAVGAKAVTKAGATALQAGEIVAGTTYELVYDGTQFQVINPTSLLQNGFNLQGALNYKRSTIAATATTTPLWTQPNGNIQDWTGTPTITDFPAAPQAGAQREAYPAAGTIITNAGNISVQGNANYTITAGDRLVVTAVTTTTFYVAVFRKDGQPLAITSKIQPITASVAANALTLTINPTSLDFRSATAGSGTVNTRTISSAISMTVSSGSTLGTQNATLARIAVLAIDSSGTIEVACVNISGGVNLDETGFISTTAEGGAGAADSAGVIYSTTARSNVPYRLVGYIESTQTTAGTWASFPSVIQGAGGSATLSTNLNAIGSAPMFACRAWVNFNGTGTVAIRASGNVSSITDNGVGDYTVNFGTAMPDANYSVLATCHQVATAGATNRSMGIYTTTETGGSTSYTTTSVRLASQISNGTNIDTQTANVAIFR